MRFMPTQPKPTPTLDLILRRERTLGKLETIRDVLQWMVDRHERFTVFELSEMLTGMLDRAHDAWAADRPQETEPDDAA